MVAEETAVVEMVVEVQEEMEIQEIVVMQEIQLGQSRQRPRFACSTRKAGGICPCVPRCKRISSRAQFSSRTGTHSDSRICHRLRHMVQ